MVEVKMWLKRCYLKKLNKEGECRRSMFLLMLVSLFNAAITVSATIAIVILNITGHDDGRCYNVCTFFWAAGIMVGFVILLTLFSNRFFYIPLH